MTLVPPIIGRCLCGQVSYRADAPPLWQAHCHCESCRRATSSGFASYFGIADGHWLWTGHQPASFNSSPGTFRDFCAVCGSQMAYRSTRYPGEIHFLAATLARPEAFAPSVHVHSDEQMPWIHLADGLERR